MKKVSYILLYFLLSMSFPAQGGTMDRCMNDTIVLEYHYTYDAWGRPLATTLSYDGEEAVTIEDNTYDALGRLSQTARNGQDSLTTQYAYNIRDWVTQIASPVFAENLYYNTSTNGSTPQWGGNISSEEWKAGDDFTLNKLRSYNFAYDGVDRLLSAAYFENAIPKGRYSTQYTYDQMGNILTLKRYGLTDDGGFGLLDDLSYDYSGNQLVKVTDSNIDEPTYVHAIHFTDGADEDVEYEYNANGSLVEDINKGLSIEYNVLNLPSTIYHYPAPVSSPETVKYVYAADGRKLHVEYYDNRILRPYPIYDGEGHVIGMEVPQKTPELMRDYCGDFIYEDGQLKRVLFDGGYITFDANSNNAPEYHFYVKDHLGNIRAVVNENNAIEELNHYYPYGSLFGESTGLSNSTQPYKYTGKELDRMHGLDLHDHGARWSDTNLGRWWKMDPLAEKYTWMSPYVLCGNNPIKFIDPNGLDWYIDKDGTYQYNPKVHSQKDLGKGQSYLGREFNSLNNGKAAYYREDGSILFDNDTEAYNRLWHQANNHYSKQAYPNGKEQGGFLLTDGRVLVLPDNNNDEFTSKIDAYGYHISPEGYVCKGEEQFPILGQIHTHQSKNASARPSYGSSNADDALLSKVLNGKPLFVLGHDNEIHGMIYSNNAVYPFDTSNTISQLLNHQIDLIGLAKQLIYSFNRKK